MTHIPATTWGFFIELTGRVCPLTYAENYLRIKAGQSGYAEGFIGNYLLAIIYHAGLTRGKQFVLAALVLVVNVAIYGWFFYRRVPLRRSIMRMVRCVSGYRRLPN